MRRSFFGLDLQANRSNRHQPTLKALMGKRSNMNSLEADDSKSLNQQQETQDATHEYALQKNIDSNGLFNGDTNRQQVSEEVERLLGNETDKIDIDTTSTNWDNQAADKTKTGFESLLNGTYSYQGKHYPQNIDAYSPIQTGSDWETTESRVLQDWEEIFDRDIKLNGYIGSRIIDASGDGSKKEVFEDGALEISYCGETLSAIKSQLRPSLDIFGTSIDIPGVTTASIVATESTSGDVVNLGSWFINLSQNSFYVNLKDKLEVNQGWLDNTSDWDIDVTIKATYANGQTFNLERFNEDITLIDPLDAGTGYRGDLKANTFTYRNFDSMLGSEFDSGRIYYGRGGTDTLVLSGINKNDILQFNGSSLAALGSSDAGGAALGQQAFYGGTVFDTLSLSNGDEIYLQGIEKISCEDGDIRIRANMSDSTKEQWNLQVMDVSGAWRFNRGSSDVVLASLDAGIGDLADNPTDIHDEIGHVVNQTNKNNTGSQHGHKAMSVMAAKHDSQGLAGIAPNSTLWAFTGGEYRDGQSHHQNIQDAISLRGENQKIVFQGGYQGDSWWETGTHTREEMQGSLDATREFGFHAIAAGNGGPDGNLEDPNYLTSVSGVAQAESTNDNIASIGALQFTGTDIVDGITNITGYQLAGYSNRGDNLTYVAPTDSRSIDADGNISTFTGTSCANPNAAGVAALVWSENTSLDGGELREILTQSAMDLGSMGRDNTYGHGLLNAESAVRRSYALAENEVLASFYSNDQFLA